MPIDDLIAHLRRVVFDESMYPGHPGFLAYLGSSVPDDAYEIIETETVGTIQD